MRIFWGNRYAVPPFCPKCGVDRQVLIWRPHRFRFWKESAFCMFDNVLMVTD